MQITIVQAEIEAAITNYIKEQVTVNEGMEINIDLRATRGAEGYQAVINIQPRGGSSRRASTPKPAPAPAPAPEPVPETKTEPVADQAPAAKTTGRKPAGRGTKASLTAVPDAEPIEQDNAPAETPAEEAATDPAEGMTPIADKDVAAEEAPAEAADTVVADVIDDTPPPPATETRSIFGGLKRPVNA